MKKPASATKPGVLPGAFLARAKKAAAISHANKLAKAKSLLASIRRRKGEMSGAFWDIGRDLSDLQRLGVESLLGHKSFFVMWLATGS
jgi:hypothetical protein